MGTLREFKVKLLGSKDDPAMFVSIVAATPIIAIYQSAIIAMQFGAKDYILLPGGRTNGNW